MSGFSMWPKSVGPADEKLVITPLRPVWISWMPLRDADRRLRRRSRQRRRAGAGRRGRRSSRPEAAAGSGSAFASPKRLSTRIRPIAPAGARALRLRGERADAARDEHDLALHRVRSAACRPAGVRIVGEPQRCESTGLPSVPTTDDDVDDRLIERRPARRAASRRPRPGSARRRASGGPPTTVSAGAKTCEFDVGGDRDRVGSRARRAGGAEAVVLAVVAGGDHRHDARERRVVDRLVHRVVGRVGLRAAAREVDDVHAVGDRGLERLRRSRACWPRGRAASGW